MLGRENHNMQKHGMDSCDIGVRKIVFDELLSTAKGDANNW